MASIRPGIAGGGGILNPYFQGMAPHSTIISQYFSDILVERARSTSTTMT
jgi:hypothetical protein